jgi:hypothetical protein
LFVASSYPVQPSASAANGPYSLTASSAADSTEAAARVGVSMSPPQVASAVSQSAVKKEGSLLVAEASADIDALLVAPDVRLGEIQSTARIAWDPTKPDVPPVKSSSLSVGRVFVAGTELALTRHGLVAAGQTVLPGDVSAAQQALAAAGVTMEYFPGSETPTSITSSSVQVTTQQNLPNLGNSTVRWVLGRVSASADGAAAALAGDLPLVAPEVRDEAPGLPASSSEGEGVAAVLVATLPSRAGGRQSTVAAGPLAATPASQSSLPDLTPLFVVLAAGAALALGSSRVTQWLEMRERLDAARG